MHPSHHRRLLPVPPQRVSETDSTISAHPLRSSQSPVSSRRPVHGRPLRIGFPESGYTPHAPEASSSNLPITLPHLIDHPHPVHTPRRGLYPGRFFYYRSDSGSFAIDPQRSSYLRPVSTKEREDLDIHFDSFMIQTPDTRSIYTEQKAQKFGPEGGGSYSGTDDDDTSEEESQAPMRSPTSHARPTSQPFRCQVCDEDFSCRVGLMRHKRTTLKHKRNMELFRAGLFRSTRHFCDCGASFTRKDSLRRHQRMSHYVPTK